MSNEKEGFKGHILPYLIEEFNLTQTQAKKLICVISLTDGYGSINKGRGEWKLETIPNEELHNLVHDLFLFCYGLKVSSRRMHKKYQATEIKGKKYRKILEDLLTFTPTFKTTPKRETIEEFKKKQQPTFEFLLNEPRWFKEIAVRLIFDLEGCIVSRVSVKRKSYKSMQYFQSQFESFLSISITNPTLVVQLKEILFSLGFSFNIKKDSREWSKIGGLITFKKKDVVHFLEIGGFLTTVKVSKSEKEGIDNNNSFFKQALLYTACEIIKNYNTSKHFRTKEEAEKWGREFMESIFVPLRNKFQELIAGRGFEFRGYLV